MMKKSPHTQSQQNANPAEADLEPGEQEQDSGTDQESAIYENMQGAETGGTRTPKKSRNLPSQHRLEEPTVAYEGSVSTRLPKKPAQGITSRSSEEESERQEKVVNERPDAQAGVNHAK